MGVEAVNTHTVMARHVAYSNAELISHALLRFCAGVMIVILACLGGEVHALPSQATEYEVKAAFIYNFARFAEWPASAFKHPDDPIQLCIWGDDSFGDILEKTVRGKTVAQHPFVVSYIAASTKARDCHIVFIGRSHAAQLGPVLEAVRDLPVLSFVVLVGVVLCGVFLCFSFLVGR